MQFVHGAILSLGNLFDLRFQQQRYGRQYQGNAQHTGHQAT